MNSSIRDNIKPMSLSSSVFFFGIPAIIIFINMYFFMRFLDNNSFPIFWNYMLIYSVLPMSLIIISVIFLVKKENHDLNLKQRLRLGKMGKSEWIWSLLLFIFMFLSAVILQFTSPIIAKIFSPPQFWPDELNPLKNTVSTKIPSEFLGQSLSGNWWVLIVILLSLIIATLGEELLWRGYVLPRQELTFGKKTWIIHGVFWVLFHIFLPWNLIAILPGALALSYVAQKKENTSPTIIAHGLANALLIIIVVTLGILN